MIALKNDPVWTALSRFGRPWPPFDYDSGMGIADIDRETAETLGLLANPSNPTIKISTEP